jgi:hypothetical protein
VHIFIIREEVSAAMGVAVNDIPHNKQSKMEPDVEVFLAHNFKILTAYSYAAWLKPDSIRL